MPSSITWYLANIDGSRMGRWRWWERKREALSSYRHLLVQVQTQRNPKIVIFSPPPKRRNYQFSKLINRMPQRQAAVQVKQWIVLACPSFPLLEALASQLGLNFPSTMVFRHNLWTKKCGLKLVWLIRRPAQRNSMCCILPVHKPHQGPTFCYFPLIYETSFGLKLIRVRNGSAEEYVVRIQLLKQQFVNN